MKRSQLRRLSLLSAFVILATIPQHIPPLIETEELRILVGRGKGITVI